MRTLLILLLCFYHIPAALNPQAKPQDYWIWGGVIPDTSMIERTLYIYQGNITTQKNQSFFNKRGISPHPLPGKNPIYIVFRLYDELPDPQYLNKLFTNIAQHWQYHDTHIQGLQLDFDTSSTKLLPYSQYLKTVRQHLSKNDKLSITGLADWLVSSDQKHLHNMLEQTDETVFQLYKGLKNHDHINTYLSALTKLKHPFKVGLIPSKHTQKYLKELSKNVHFQGTLFFLLSHHFAPLPFAQK